MKVYCIYRHYYISDEEGHRSVATQLHSIWRSKRKAKRMVAMLNQAIAQCGNMYNNEYRIIPNNLKI